MYGRKMRNFDGNNPRSGISSDDPNALAKLKAKLAETENFQDMMKKVNAVIKREHSEEGRIGALVTIGHEPAQAKSLLQPDYAGRIGFKEYQLTNNGANIRRIRERIAELEKAANWWIFSGRGGYYGCHQVMNFRHIKMSLRRKIEARTWKTESVDDNALLEPHPAGHCSRQ